MFVFQNLRTAPKEGDKNKAAEEKAAADAAAAEAAKKAAEAK